MSELSHLTVFTGSATGADLDYQYEVRRLGRTLAEEGIGIVYGGGKVGLMGHIADAALEAGGEVRGIIPQVLVEREIAHPALTHMDLVEDMHDRKKKMADYGDAFIALPGGMGTLEEFFEAWTWQYLNIHAKPVGLYNVRGFWDPLLAMVDHMVAEGFMAEWRRDALVISDEPQELVVRLREWELPR